MICRKGVDFISNTRVFIVKKEASQIRMRASDKENQKLNWQQKNTVEYQQLQTWQNRKRYSRKKTNTMTSKTEMNV